MEKIIKNRKIAVTLNSTSSSNLVDVFQAPTFNKSGLLLIEESHLLENITLVNYIQNIPSVEYPMIPLEASDSERDKTLLDLAWKSPRIHVGVYLLQDQILTHLETQSLLSPKPYPYAKINIEDIALGPTSVLKLAIIDVGCGGGRYSNALRLLKAKQVTGVDYSDDGIFTAKKNYKFKNISFKKQNVLKLKFKKNTFDIVFCNGVLHHTNDFKKGIKELHRICKPGGYIYLYLYGTGGLYWSARRQMNKLMKLIPQEYSQQVLDLIGMPNNRFIFMDNWYVPYERHCSHKEVYKILQSLGVEFIEKMKAGRKTDLETGLLNFKNSKIIWGEGEIRLLIKKSN